MRRLIIGDIHACYDELQELIDRAGLSRDDEIIATGDILDRGPDSYLVMEFFANQVNACSVMGNHERKHIRSFHRLIKPAISQIIVRKQFDELGENCYQKSIEWLKTMPLFLDLPEAIIIHAFFEPRIPLSEQKENVIVGTLSGEMYMQQMYKEPWYSLYDNDKPLIVGHLNYAGTGQPFIYKDHVFCIDTGCCHGGNLTGIILPDFHIISVKSHRNYWAMMKSLYESSIPEPFYNQMSWSKIDEFIAKAENQNHLPDKAKQKLSSLKSIKKYGEIILNKLFEYIINEHQKVLNELKGLVPYDQLSAREQGSIYAEHVGQTAISRLLHVARKGELSIDNLRNRFKTPKDLLKFAESIKLISDEESENFYESIDKIS